MPVVIRAKYSRRARTSVMSMIQRYMSLYLQRICLNMTYIICDIGNLSLRLLKLTNYIFITPTKHASSMSWMILMKEKCIQSHFCMRQYARNMKGAIVRIADGDCEAKLQTGEKHSSFNICPWKATREYAKCEIGAEEKYACAMCESIQYSMRINIILHLLFEINRLVILNKVTSSWNLPCECISKGSRPGDRCISPYPEIYMKV